MSSVSNELFFAYGTLMRGFGNHRAMLEIGGEFRGEAISVTPFPLVVTDLPYLLDYPGEGFRVEGEIYRIPGPGPGWESIDRLEGHPHFYRRRIESFKLGNETVAAWVYFLAREPSDLCRHNPVNRFGLAGGDRQMV